MAATVHILTELYHPERTSTGHLLTELAEELAKTRRVRVTCGQPTYFERQVRAPTRECLHGVEIRRCWSTRFDKNGLAGRFVNLVTVTLSLALRALWRVSRGEVVLVVTNPPVLPFLVWAVSRLRGARCVLLVHDVYPDVLAPAGILRPESFPYRMIGKVTGWLYRHMDRVIVLGRCMKGRVDGKLGPMHPGSVVIANWADVEVIRPLPKASSSRLAEWGWTERFIVLYSGNLGRTHGIDDLIGAVCRLGPERYGFVVAGWGAARAALEAEVRARGLDHLRVVDPVPRERLAESLAGCDLALIALKAGMSGISVPSRFYNILAAGRPVVAVCEPDCELALVIQEYDVGWVVPPGRPEELAAVVARAAALGQDLQAWGERARKLAECRFTLSSAAAEYSRVCDEVSAAVS